ncbi:MAG: hypothetical protein FWG87_10800 [Defluviitaleaceae bacterium]|nr:hypothetical protein [Defluviitaleaceae bacterium]
MVINNNIPALFTHLSMRRADRGLQQAMTRLSSGMRINSAKEDAAGLAISNKLNYQVSGLRQASENSTHGISLIQTAEGALNEVHNMLQRMRELSVQAAHGTLNPENLAMVQLEIEELTTEIHAISRNTEFNRMKILNGEASRVVDNSMWQGALGGDHVPEATRNIVNTLYVSPHVSEGQLNYTIQQAGLPAMIELNPDLSQLEPEMKPDPNDPNVQVPTGREVFPADTGFKLNNLNIDMSGKTWEEVQYKLNEELKFMGITMYQPSATDDARIFLVSNLAGSDQKMAVTGELSIFGLTESISNTGRDALVTTNDPDPAVITTDGGQPIIGGLLDSNGNRVPGASLAATTSGNQVFFRGSNGEDIRMSIQVAFDPDAAPGEYFRFPGADGFPVSDLDAGNRLEDGLYMTKDFRSYGPLMLQIGASHNTAMAVQIPRLNAETLGLVEYVGGVQRMIIDVKVMAIPVEGEGIRHVGADRAINILDRAIRTVSDSRARLGAYQNRLESTVSNLDVAAENTEISRSRIQDTDMARETTRYAQFNVMYQAAMSILGQANQRPQQIIALLQ